jgi:RNA polymerase sigma factor (sigma-70 family)
MTIPDKEILIAIKEGQDSRVLSYLYKKVLPKVKNYIRSNSGSDDDAYDIFQDAIMAFYKYVKTGKYNEKYEIDGFIYSVSRNLWINKAKKDKRKVSLPDNYKEPAYEENIVSGIVSKEREKMIAGLLSQLGERCQQLLTYSIFYKMSLAEISDKMGFANENAVKTKKYKCKQRLIDLIEKNPSLKDQLKG